MTHRAQSVRASSGESVTFPAAASRPDAALLGVVAVCVTVCVVGAVEALLTELRALPLPGVGRLPIDEYLVAWAGLIALGALAGLAGRRRLRRGLLVLVLAGLVGAVVLWTTGASSPAHVLSPVAVGAGAGALFAALHPRLVPRRRPSPMKKDAAGDAGSAGGSVGGSPTGRRKVLLLAAVAAMGVGVGGFSRGIVTVVPTSLPPRRVVPPPPHTATTGPANRGPTVDVRAHGAVGDGHTDDGPAIRAALAEANPVGGTVFLPAGVYYYRATGGLDLAAGATLAGIPGRSVINLDSATPGAFVSFCTPTGDDTLIDGLTINRVGDFPCVVFRVRGVSGLTVNRVTLNGKVQPGDANYCHGIQLGLADGAVSERITVTSSTFTDLSYGLFQTNTSTATTRTIRVSDCTFMSNSQTDLELNSPLGTISDAVVERCRFSDHEDYGFGVGVAHASAVTVRDCSFANFTSEAVHIEDYSDGVVVQGNEFTACGLREFSHVQVIGGATRVQVLGNSFEASMNTSSIHCVAMLAGGSDPTAGNRPPAPPSNVVVQDNTFECSTTVGGIYLEGVAGAVVAGNVLVGDGVRARRGEDPQQRAVTTVDSAPTLTDNTVNGVRY